MQLKEMSGQAQGIPVQQVGWERFGFSPGGHELALTSNDGRLAVWDAKVKQIKHEFIPSAHLSAACTCLSWMPPTSPKSPSKSRKRKTSTSSGTGGSLAANGTTQTPTRSDAIALGTAAGAVLIYSLKTGDVTSHLSKEHAPHKDQVNDIVWDSLGIAIFTVSNDGHVCNINVRKSAVIYKFRGSLNPDANVTEALTSICLHPSEQSVLVGSLSKLTWWDLDTRSVLKIFEGGHVGSVTSLAVATSSLNNCYAISGGCNLQKDHTLTVWKLSLDDQEKSGRKTKTKSSKATEPCAKLSVNDSARTVFVAEATVEEGKRKRKSSANESEEDLVFGAVTRSGVLHCFRQNLLSALNSGSRKKPIKADHVVQIATEKSSSGHVTNLPILDAKFRDANSIDVAYGTKMLPAFETLEVSSMEKSTCLVRNVSLNVKAPKGDSNRTSNLVVPDTSGTKVMAPGPTMVEPQAGTKRKQPGGDKSLSMVDRLKLLSRDEDQKTTPPRTDSMIQLLLQGLHNHDRRILDSVLDRADGTLITNTVRKLPVEGVVPLVQELQHYIKGRGIVNQSHSRWLESTLQIHAAHLISLPHCEELLGPVCAMLEARTKHYHSLLLLKGKLDIMTKQIATKPDPNAEKETLGDKKALLVYQDDSGDELNEKMDDLLLPPSDTDDNWIMDEDSDGEEEEDEAKKQSEEEESDDSEVDFVENGDEDMDSDD